MFASNDSVRVSGLSKKVLLGAFVALGLTVVIESAAQAGSYSRPYAGNGYNYRYYRYYSPSNRSYRCHLAVYYPSRPRYIYYYNPYRKVYWGRYDLVTGGYSKLDEEDRKGALSQIPESAFPEPAAMPAIADSDGSPMLPPPESLPPQTGGENPVAAPRGGLQTSSYPARYPSSGGCH